MKNKILNNFTVKVLAVVFAVLIWIIIANIDDYIITKQINDIPVEIINGDAITSNDKLYEVVEGQTVDVIIKGKRSVVDYLTSNDLKAVADLSKLSVTNAVQIVVTPISSSVERDISISCVDNMMIVKIEDKVEKQLPITVVTEGKPHSNYAVGAKTAAPNMVTVTGSETVISRLKEARVVVNVNGANSDVTKNLEIDYYDGNGDLVDSSNVECDILNVEVTVEILKTKTVPVSISTVGEVKEGYSLISVDFQPTELKLAGGESGLQNINVISLNDISVDGLASDSEIAIDITDYLPEEIFVADGTEQIMVKLVVEKLQTKSISFKASDIGLLGESDSYKYDISATGDMKVSITGLSDLVSDITIKDIKPQLDVTSLSPGTYNMDITFKNDEDMTINNTVSINLIIKSK